jgi:serine/threonine-protein kinase
MNPGSTIGHYRIVGKLGEGGMGAVYRATDTKLNRDVAIKVLPDALANDPDYLARFTREAQVLASLNHPNIAILHGVEDRALVMELVPGQTLDELIAAGPIPLEDALGIARQVAEALEAAHDKGVVHRDLKPANVKLTPEGVVKVLDFGLAKAAEPAASAAVANSPTLTLRATQAGLIMGTAGYMAPEQAAGKPVDRRADIWSFGVVLYELLTGKTLFTGETISHTLASVLKDQIDFAIPQAPPPIRRLLARCLTRDPRERLRDIGEARIAIRNFLANPVVEEAPKPLPAAVPRGSNWPLKLACAVLLLALAGTLAWTLKPSPAPQITRFPLLLPPGQALTAANRQGIAISRDGSQIAYVANRQLFLRSLAELQPRAIFGAEKEVGGHSPVFSPDGQSIAYADGASTQIKRIPVAGGTLLTLGEGGARVYGGAWTSDGLIFSINGKGIVRYPPAGGAPELLVPTKENEIIAEPTLLPGGRAVLFTFTDFVLRRGVGWAQAQIVVQDLKSGARKTLLTGGHAARYLRTGHIAYVSNGVLYAVPFDASKLEVTGGAVTLIEGVASGGPSGQFAVSDAGTLIYVPGPVTASDSGQSALSLVDRSGEVEQLKAPPAAYAFPRVSRDGKRVAYQLDDVKEPSIWIWELGSSAAPRRLTLPGSGANRYPVWSADGERVAFQSDREGDDAIWWQRADGQGTAERLTRPAAKVSHIPDSFSPDGGTLSYTEDKGNASEVWTLSLNAKTPASFAAAPGMNFGRSVFSPDGKWIAYQTNAQPNSRIYVRPYPPTATAYLAPEDRDSHHPVWSPDGKELFYIAGPSQSGSFTFTAQPVVTFGPPRRMPHSGFLTAVPGSVRPFDILPDGKHFLGTTALIQTDTTGPAGAGQIQVVLNWFEELKQRTAAK